jgi:hypothetical protein
MPENQYSPQDLPEKFGFSKNENAGLLLTLLDILDLELTKAFFPTINESIVYEEFLCKEFGDFQTWCWEIYKSYDKADDVYLFFTDARVRYQLVKEKNFYRKGDKIHHVLLSDPISKDGNLVQRLLYINHDFLNRAIKVLEDYINKVPEKNKLQKSSSQGFRAKNRDILGVVFDKLIIHKVISGNYKDFQMAFSGWMPQKKIIWLLTPGYLYYFINEINGKGIETEDYMWVIAANCFQKEDLTEFDPKRLKGQKKPKNTTNVDFAIKAFNKES